MTTADFGRLPPACLILRRMVITGSTRQKGHMRLYPLFGVNCQQPSGLWLLQPAAACERPSMR